MPTPAVHPDIEAYGDRIPRLVLDHELIAKVRAAGMSILSTVAPPVLSETVERTDHVVDDDTGVTVRVHRPQSLRPPAACLYSIHGGGYVLGSNVMDDAMFDRYCNRYGCVGVSVEYRLAPEAPYPAPLEDCYRGLAWTFDRAGDLGIDPSRIGIMGVSAGGGLAAALALLARDRGEMAIAFQLLQCPMLDDRQASASSRYDDLLVWTRESNAFGWQCYLGALYGTDEVPGYAAAARAADLEGLPPAMVIVGGADGFRDENITYALRLGQAGVPTDVCVIAGAPHGVQLFVGTEPERRWSRAVEEWLRPRLSHPVATLDP